MNPARREAGIQRRMRLWFVRRTLWEKANPQHRPGCQPPVYAYPWNSRNALNRYSPACACHKRERYSRKTRS